MSTKEANLPSEAFLESLPTLVRNSLNAAQHILMRNGATKIILYGSMARGTSTEHSDIDLCVDGLQGISYFHAVGECLIDIDFPISVVPLNNIYGYFRERVLREGKVIYER